LGTLGMWRAWKRALQVLSAGALLAGVLLGARPARAEGNQPYQMNEFVVRLGPELQDTPILGGSWIVWREGASGNTPAELKLVHGRNLANGQSLDLTPIDVLIWPPDIDNGILVAAEHTEDGRQGIFGYLLTDQSRFTIAPLQSGGPLYRAQPRISGNLVVWMEGTNLDTAMDLYARDLSTGRTFPVCTDPAQQQWPAVSGNIVVWADARNRGGSSLPLFDLYGYDASAGREFRITRQPEVIGAPAISGQTVVWWAQRDREYRLLAYDITTGQERVIANLGFEQPRGVDIDSGIIVWSARPGPWGDYDVYGYDLAQDVRFTISRAIGDQIEPRISGRVVVWTDTRNRKLTDQNSDIYGASLTPGPAPMPPASGAPSAVDAKIQIVWPHDGAPVSQASLANVGSYLLQKGTLKPTPCQWHPNVQLWRAVNNGPARLVGSATQASTLLWEHNNVDVSAARDPQNKVFFYVSVEGYSWRSNVWAHAADARTYFPKADVPTGVGAVTGPVDAKIEIVWPQGGLPVSQATKANITANLFLPDTLTSVPPDWSPTVRLWRALNSSVAEEVGTGYKRLVTANGIIYPVWDFNNVDVSAARNAANKYYFYLTVDGVQAYSNVWAHGVDARSLVPQKDTLDGGCS